MESSERSDLRYFIWLGFIVGGLLPTTIPWLLQLTTSYQIIPAAHLDAYTITAVLFVVSSVLFLFGAEHLQDNWPTLGRVLRTLCAAVSIVALSLFVWLTGGATGSPLAFSYLYIPSVVVASFRDKTTWLCTAVACFVGYLINLFYPWIDGGSEWAIIQESISYKGTVALIFLIQLIIVVVIPMKENATMPSTTATTPAMSRPKAQRYGWFLFDAANSLLIAAGAIYFGPWLMDNGINTAWLTVAVGVSSVISLFIGPMLGRLLDEGLPPRRIMVVCSLAMGLGTLTLQLLAMAKVQGASLAVFAAVAFVILFGAYQLSLVPYNALLRPLAGDGSIDRLSGVGQVWNAFGLVLGTTLVLPFVSGAWQWNPSLGRGQAFGPAVIMYAVLTVISLVLINETARVSVAGKTPETVRIRDVAKIIGSSPNLLYFGIFFLLFSDVAITLETNASAVMNALAAFSDSKRSLVLVVTLACATIASVVIGLVASKTRSPNRPRLMLISALPAVLGPGLLALFPGSAMIWIALPLTGMSAGAVRTIARAHYSAIAPRSQLGSVVGVYASLERSGAVLGALTWSLVLFLTDAAIVGYQIALGFAAAFVVAAMICLVRAERSASPKVTL